MFMQKWREHWGMKEDPYAYEDADKDLILTEVDPSAVHWSFDRIYGNPKMPAPGITFGEKGSGKSALRLMIKRKIQEYNKENPDHKVFEIEYIDFNPYLDNFRRAVGVRGDINHAAQETIKRWKISDHIDCILSMGITKLVDEIIASASKQPKLSGKEKNYLLLLTSIYYDSEKRTVMDAIRRLKKLFGFMHMRPVWRWLSVIFFTIIFLAVGLFPIYQNVLMEALGFQEKLNIPENSDKWFYIAGLAGLVITWGFFCLKMMAIRSKASKAAKSVKVLQNNPVHASNLLKNLSPKDRKEFLLPRGSDTTSRYHILDQFMDILENFNYYGIYVMLDRIDEPSMLSARIDQMRIFVEGLMDLKFLQYPKIGLKLFLPLELDEIHRNASPEQLKRMRLDKSNLISELKWSGQELYEIANQRMISCQKNRGEPNHLADLFAEDVDFSELRETLTLLGTPRYAFGFFSSLFTEYVKDLPNDLTENDPRWKISHNYFEVTKAAWIDRSGVLRRVLN